MKKSDTTALRHIRKALTRLRIDALLVSKPANTRYLCNFSTPEDGRFLVTRGSVALFTDSRYEIQAKEECPFPVTIWKGKQRWKCVKDFLKESGVRKLGVEGEAMSASEFSLLGKRLRCKLKSTQGIIEQLRIVKRPDELAKIRKAASINDRAFTHILPFIRAGRSEKDIALELEWFVRKQADFRIAFEFIVAAGPNGAKPHAQPTARRIQTGDLLTLDFGSIWEGYRSDMTRTVAIGKPSRELRAIYGAVRRAEREGLNAIKAGVKGRTPDQAARQVIEERGFGEFFGHGLGHGVGLEIHEAPRLSPYSSDRLKSGMVVTCEPGIYVPELGGVRIEDLVVVTRDGCELLSQSPKKLICL